MRPRSWWIRTIAIAILLLAWLVYWSRVLRPHEAALGVLVASFLVALLAQRIVPVAWAAPWDPAQRIGASTIVLGALAIVTGHVLRVDRFDPPRMEWQQVPVLGWAVGLVLMLAGAWQLLSHASHAEPPACAECGATARASTCSRCNARLV